MDREDKYIARFGIVARSQPIAYDAGDGRRAAGRAEETKLLHAWKEKVSYTVVYVLLF